MAVQFNRDSGAQFKKVKISVSTGKAEAKQTKEEEIEVPATLADAVKAEGEKLAFRRYINSLVIDVQADLRAELRPAVEGKERKRASYLETLGI